jgi:hypothetical protein
MAYSGHYYKTKWMFAGNLVTWISSDNIASLRNFSVYYSESYVQINNDLNNNSNSISIKYLIYTTPEMRQNLFTL